MRRFGFILVTAILIGAFWLFWTNITGAPDRVDGFVQKAGDKVRVGGSGKPSVTLAEGVVVGPAGLAIPVAGVRADQLVDTFTQARAGGARVHDAIDIMAAEGAPVVASGSGTVEKLFFSGGGGGISAYIRSRDGRWIYYYAHLQSYAPGLVEGQRVGRGALIGFVGHSGNASPAGPHLHFAISRMAPDEKWFQGTPINPYPLLAGKAVRR